MPDQENHVLIYPPVQRKKYRTLRPNPGFVLGAPRRMCPLEPLSPNPINRHYSGVGPDDLEYFHV
jgi:hypothetical protein